MRDQEYAALVGADRALLQGVAYLMAGEARTAERMVQLVLARAYERWDHLDRPRIELLRALVRTDPRHVGLPWESNPRIELIDLAARPAPADPIVADLLRLTPEQRAAFVLERYAEWPGTRIAEVLECSVDHVGLLTAQAYATVAAGDPRRRTDAELARQLHQAVPPALRVAAAPAADMTHGRTLVAQANRRRAVLAAGIAAVLVAVIATLAVVLPRPQPAAAPDPASDVPQPTASGSASACNRAQPSCQQALLFAWRSEMAGLARSHLDPEGRYFTGFGYSYDARYDTGGYWPQGQGALGFEIFRLEKGSTEVYLQLATDRRYALTCGETTGHRCFSSRFMDGNTFTVSETSDDAKGVEVQLRRQDAVVTAIARNVTAGPALEISTTDLMHLLLDPALRLPSR